MIPAMQRAVGRRRGAIAATVAILTLPLAAAAAPARAQQPGDDEMVAAVYHQLTGEPLDWERVAGLAERVRRASSFDRRDATAAEVQRLQRLVAAADPGREFVARVHDQISDYDHDRGEFSIRLFEPGYFVEVAAFGQRYQLVFTNAEPARAIPMPREQAREFDRRLAALGRGVVNEVRYRVTGAGDPSGAVTGPRVVRAEIVSARLLDRNGAVVHVPSIAPAGAVAVAGAAAGVGGGSGGAAPAFDAGTADVAGFRVGTKASDLEATLQRLFGAATRRAAARVGDDGIAGVLVVNELGCVHLPGARRAPKPGDVCVTARYDADEVVRAIRVERVFPWMDEEVFRRTMVQRYGAVAGAQRGGGFSLGWGPEVAAPLRYSASGPPNALTAHYVANDGFMSRGNNSLPQIRIVLQLADAAWAAARAP